MSYREGSLTQVDVRCGDCAEKADRKPRVLAVGTVQHGVLVDLSTLHRADRPHRRNRAVELYDLADGADCMSRSTGYHDLKPKEGRYVLTCSASHWAPNYRSKPPGPRRIEVNANRLKEKILEAAAVDDDAIAWTFVRVHSEERPSIARTRRHRVW